MSARAALTVAHHHLTHVDGWDAADLDEVLAETPVMANAKVLDELVAAGGDIE